MALLYADEDFSFPVVKVLRQLGHDVLTALEDGRAEQGIPDGEVFARAFALGRAVLTHNRKHFRNIHRGMPAHLGLIACTQDSNSEALATRIDAALRGNIDLSGKLVRIVRPPNTERKRKG